MRYFTADQHFGHANIIKYCNRPFTTVREMNDEMVWQWNNVVNSDDDIVYQLGDFTLGDEQIAQLFFAKLQGRIKVLSNPWHHDRRWLASNHTYVSANGEHVAVLPPMKVLELADYGSKFPQALVLCHYPLAEWDRKHHGSWHLHGHSHGNYNPGSGLIFDVGVDSNQFTPVSLDEVVRRMKAYGWKQKDG